MPAPLPARRLDRRSLLRLAGAGGLAALASSTLAACGSSASGSSGAAKDFGTVALQLSWLENNEFSGEFIADTRGYYKAEGFSGVTLISGGPSVSVEPAVVAGKAFMGISSPDVTASAILKGADLVVIGAQYQKNPFAIMSMTKTPITTPQAMVGKRIGVQSGNEAIWQAFLKANHLDASTITKVPVQFDPTPLTVGTVDGWFSYFTNEPNLLRAKGFDVTVMSMQDFNYPLVNETYLVTRTTLQKKRDAVKALLRAEIRGWQGSIADPALGPRLAIAKYGKSLGLEQNEQTLESVAQNTLIRTPETEADGIFTISQQAQQQTISSLALGGITITAAKLFDTSVIDEIYKEDAALKTLPPTPSPTASS